MSYVLSHVRLYHFPPFCHFISLLYYFSWFFLSLRDCLHLLRDDLCIECLFVRDFNRILAIIIFLCLLLLRPHNFTLHFSHYFILFSLFVLVMVIYDQVDFAWDPYHYYFALYLFIQDNIRPR